MIIADPFSTLRFRRARLVGIVLLGAAAIVLACVRASVMAPPLFALPLAIGLLIPATYVFFLACAGGARAMGAFLFVFAFVTDGAFRVRDPGDIGLDWQNGMKFVLWGGAFLIGLCHWNRIRPLLTRGPLLWAAVYVCYALLSSLYSAAPFYSFTTAFGLLAMLLFGLALATRLTPRHMLLTLATSLWIFTLLGWVVYYQVPALGRSPFITAENTVIERICGLAGQANALGCILAVLLTTVFLLWERRLAGLWLILPMAGTAIFTLLSADSRTALLAFCCGVAAVLLRRSVWSMGGSLLGAALVALAVLGMPLRELFNLLGGISRSGDPTEFFTLTGRTEIWGYAWDKIVLAPWFGYGYNSSKFILPNFYGLPGLQVDEAHNMLLQNLLAVGIIGTVPLVCMLIRMVVDYFRRPSAGRDAYLSINLVWGITVAGTMGSTPTVMSLAMFCAMGYAELESPSLRSWPIRAPLRGGIQRFT